MAPKAVVVVATTLILSGQPRGVGHSVVTVARFGSDIVVRPISGRAAWNGEPPSTASQFHSTMGHLRPGLSTNFEKRDMGCRRCQERRGSGQARRKGFSRIAESWKDAIHELSISITT